MEILRKNNNNNNKKPNPPDFTTSDSALCYSPGPGHHSPQLSYRNRLATGLPASTRDPVDFPQLNSQNDAIKRLGFSRAPNHLITP